MVKKRKRKFTFTKGQLISFESGSIVQVIKKASKIKRR